MPNHATLLITHFIHQHFLQSIVIDCTMYAHFCWRSVHPHTQSCQVRWKTVYITQHRHVAIPTTVQEDLLVLVVWLSQDLINHTQPRDIWQLEVIIVLICVQFKYYWKEYPSSPSSKLLLFNCVDNDQPGFMLLNSTVQGHNVTWLTVSVNVQVNKMSQMKAWSRYLMVAG